MSNSDKLVLAQSHQSYVYDGAEVRKTGREATKEIGTLGARVRTMVLVEITPVDEAFDWKKWVDPAQLYIIKPT